MKAKLLLVIFLLFVCFVSAVVHMPAAVAVRWVSIPSNVLLQGVSGTLWRGKIENVNVNAVDLGKVLWQLKPSRLVKGLLGADVRFGEKSAIQMRGKGQVGLSFSSLWFEQFSVQVPSTELVHSIDFPLPINVAGEVSMFIEEYQYDGEHYCNELQGTATWQNATLAVMSAPLYLADVSAVLSCDNHQVIAETEQQSQQVSSEFEVGLTHPNQFSVTGWFRPNAEFPESFTQQLNWLPQPDAENRYQINQSGRW